MKRTFIVCCLLALACNLRATPATRTIVVFPFENRSSQSDLGWISEAFAEILSERLAGPGRYILGHDERTAAYSQLGVPPATVLTLASEYKVAQTLGVDWAIVGHFKVTGQQLSATAQLLNVHKLRLHPRLEASGALADLISIQANLAWRILATYDASFTAGTEEDFARQFPPVRLDAFENYIRGVLAADDGTRIHFLREADRLNPSDHHAAFQLGRYYFDQKDYSNSARWLGKLVPVDQHYDQSLFLLGVDDFFLGRNKESQAAFQTLSLAMPLNEVWNNLGVLQARAGNDREALKSFRRAHDGDNRDPTFCFNLGASYYYLKNYQQSAKYLDQAVELDANDLRARTLLASALGKMGNSGGEQKQLTWVADHDGSSMADLAEDILPQPRITKSYNGKAFRLLSVTVHNTLEQKLSTLPPEAHGSFHLAQGRQLVSEGRYPEAIRELQEAVALIPESSECYLLLGQAYELSGKHQEALREFQTSLQLDNNAATHLWLAHTYQSMKQPAEALGEAETALSMNPGDKNARKMIESIQQQSSTAKKTP
ncbi:MAG TPA: tetratricopeptide repeat protein [Terriglobia bacterium]|nr:tetratricopeptide repeat protein [Terriglobia bacterium]